MRWIVSLIISIAGGLLVAFTTQHGLELTPDSLSYLSAAESFHAGLGFLHADGSLMTIFPPFYSVTLAVLPHAMVAAISFAATIFLAGVLLQNAGVSRSSYYVGVLATAGSSLLLWVYTFMWSETVFIPLALGALALLHQADQPRILVAAAVITGFAMLTRYAGFALMGTGIAIVLWTHRQKGLRALGYGLLYGSISFIPLGLWMTRNIMSGSGAMGMRIPASYNVPTAVVDMLSTLGGWLPYFIGISLVAGLLILMGEVWRRQ